MPIPTARGIQLQMNKITSPPAHEISNAPAITYCQIGQNRQCEQTTTTQQKKSQECHKKLTTTYMTAHACFTRGQTPIWKYGTTARQQSRELPTDPCSTMNNIHCFNILYFFLTTRKRVIIIGRSQPHATTRNTSSRARYQ
jgi:hypothetical protein